jgi:hypothetical protein
MALSRLDDSSQKDILRRARGSAQQLPLSRVIPCFIMGEVTQNNDPLHLRRLKVRLQWQNEDGMQQQTTWVKRGTLETGPTDPRRGMEWGLDYRTPEVRQNVFCFFNAGNIHDGYYFGMPIFAEGDRVQPQLEKDEKHEYSLRWRWPNGTEICVGTDGSVSVLINGHFTVKVQGHAKITARGNLKLIATNVVQVALNLWKRITSTFVDNHHIRPADDPELKEDLIEMMTGTPGKEDPGIRKPEDLH